METKIKEIDDSIEKYREEKVNNFIGKYFIEETLEDILRWFYNFTKDDVYDAIIVIDNDCYIDTEDINDNLLTQLISKQLEIIQLRRYIAKLEKN